MDVICTLENYFDVIINAIGSLILSVVNHVGACYFCEFMFMNDNRANGFIVLL